MGSNMSKNNAPRPKIDHMGQKYGQSGQKWAK